MIKNNFVLRHRYAPWVWACLLTLYLFSSTAAHLFAQGATPVPPLPPQNRLSPPQEIKESTDQSSNRTIVARVYFHNQEDVDGLVARYDVWQIARTAQQEHGYLVALLSTAEAALLQSQGYRVEIDASRTAQLAQPSLVASSQQSGIPGYACYRTVEEAYSALAALATAHPQLATWTDVGDSWEKETPGGAAGYDIYALKLTNSAIPGPKPIFLLIAAIHAREYTTAELASRFAEALVAKYGIDPDVTWLLDYFEVHIMPQTNPDGRKLAEGGQLWRKNTNNTDGCTTPGFWGTDLNRNSSFRWDNGGSSDFACDITYHGSSPASEPETQTIENYIRTIFPDQRGPNDNDAAPANAQGVFISLHSYSELVLFPWGFTTAPAPNVNGLQTLGRKFGYYNGYQVCTGPACLYGTSGTTDDFAYGELGVASYTIELGQNFFEQCNFFENTIIPQNLPALYYAAKAARRPYQTPSGPDILQPTVTYTGTTALFKATVDDTRYNSNGWGLEPSQPISAVRLTIDSPSWITGTQSYTLTATDGLFDTAVESVTGSLDISSWQPGKRLILLEGQDQAGNWGAPTGLFVAGPGTVETPAATVTPTPIVTPTVTPIATPVPTTTAGYQLYFPIANP